MSEGESEIAAPISTHVIARGRVRGLPAFTQALSDAILVSFKIKVKVKGI
jgi:hypothetical protein